MAGVAGVGIVGMGRIGDTAQAQALWSELPEQIWGQTRPVIIFLIILS